MIDFKDKNYENEILHINKLRILNKEIILIINKDDNHEKKLDIKSFGIDKIFFISCAHNHGFDLLYEYFENYNENSKNLSSSDFSIAVFGKPNAGKSTLVNGLLGYDRITTSPIAGTTSDLVEDTYNYKKTFKIHDTAGIFKK